ncbi:hypothetical protein [Endozoicomonas sp. ONNA2]|uniref:hypothetical protein n=1 Tax=Endozoicomonas sp. ONNA2 TaxID=2828741 RepID=UPI002147BA2B|nr:hypothetical protein [Endozoicomonas sp. ONNA2]
MTISPLQTSLNSTQGYLDASQQCSVQQGLHSTPTRNICRWNCVNHVRTSTTLGDNEKRLSGWHSISVHQPDHIALKGAANHNRVVNEGRAATKTVAMAALLSSFSEKELTLTRSSDFSHHQKSQQRVIMDKPEDVRKGMPREKNIIERRRKDGLMDHDVKRVVGSSDRKWTQQENSVLFQGRKNHDHYPHEGRKPKKHDSHGAKTSWHRNPGQLMVSLSKVEWQSRKSDNVKPSGPGLQSYSVGLDKAKLQDLRPLKATLKHVSGAFGEHLRENAQRICRGKKWEAISNDRTHRHCHAEEVRDLKFQIEEGIEEYREQKLIGS